MGRLRKRKRLLLLPQRSQLLLHRRHHLRLRRLYRKRPPLRLWSKLRQRRPFLSSRQPRRRQKHRRLLLNRKRQPNSQHRHRMRAITRWDFSRSLMMKRAVLLRHLRRNLRKSLLLQHRRHPRLLCRKSLPLRLWSKLRQRRPFLSSKLKRRHRPNRNQKDSRSSRST